MGCIMVAGVVGRYVVREGVKRFVPIAGGQVGKVVNKVKNTVRRTVRRVFSWRRRGKFGRRNLDMEEDMDMDMDMDEEELALACAGACIMVAGVVGRYVVKEGVKRFVPIAGGQVGKVVNKVKNTVRRTVRRVKKALSWRRRGKFGRRDLDEEQ